MRSIDADALIDDLKHDIAMDQDSLDYEELTDSNREMIQFDKDCKQNAIDLLQNAPTIEPEQRWIPCSERLPEHSERYLITAFDGTYQRTTVVPYQPRNGTWALTGRMAYWRVLAWMPLPEPYVDDIPIEYFESGGK